MKKIDYMGQVSMTVRMDSDLKKSFDALCSQFGMSANTAMTVFAKAVVQRGKIPFEIRGDKTDSRAEGINAFRQIRTLAESGALPDLSLDEINEEIALARDGR
ncbi:MAG: type II toxin-antitoxin system RelB/DinJ family antitoxin [Candidatus Cryptobacteroides sp.]